MKPLFPTDKILDGVFVVYDGPTNRFCSNRLGGHSAFNPYGFISNNRRIAPEAKPAFIVRVKRTNAYKDFRRAERIAIRQRAIDASKEKQAIRERHYTDLEPYGA